MRRLRRLVDDEDGSSVPLIVGYVVLALAVVIVCVDATSLFIAQKRIDAVADAAALAGADGFELRIDGGEPRAVLTDGGVWEQAAALVADTPIDSTLVAADAPDGVSARVTVATTWHPPILSVFVPGGVELTSTATGRTALR